MAVDVESRSGEWGRKAGGVRINGENIAVGSPLWAVSF